MKSKEKIVMWTGQQDIVMKTLNETGWYVVKRSYVEQKYKETAWIFQEAYQYLAQCTAGLLTRPMEAESPVWVYKYAHQIYGGEGTTYLELEIPRNQVIIFDMRKWNRILNLDFVGKTQQEEEEFQKWLEKRGIRDNLAVFSTSFYPVEKQEIKKSWRNLLEIPVREEEYIQGMTWELKKEWIKKACK
ncbi:MAG: DUF3841 domain-containing protein [Muricomes sp.]